jgi:ferredoxin
MHPILTDFLEKWVCPSGFTGPGVEFCLRQTERCLPLWDKLVAQAIQFAEKDLASGSEEYKAFRARAGYAAEGPFMSLKQMSTQILSVTVSDQPRFIDLQRMRARQIWDEVKHGQLHADVLLRGGFIKREEELMDDPRTNTQPKLSYFGMTAMFPHIHPLARAGRHYYNESMACIGIAATLSVIDDDLVRHQLHSQSAEELMHFIEGKYQIDAYALGSEDQKPIEAVFDFLLRPWASEPSRALGAAKETVKVRIVEARCIACGLCREACPESAVHPKMQDIHHMYEVLEGECTGCGECLPYCPAPGALAQYDPAQAGAST